MLNLKDIFSQQALENQEACELNRQVLKQACETCVNNTPACAEQTIAIRKMQEAMFYFNAAITSPASR